MAAGGLSVSEASHRETGKPGGLERPCRALAAVESARPCPRRVDEPKLELSSGLDVSSHEERSGSRPLWKPGQPSAAAALLERCLAAKAVTQETLDLTRRETPCFVKFSEMERMANMQAEINEIKLKTEMMQLENETADITHLFYLGKKYEILQDMNSHLEAVLKEKRALRKRLIKPRYQESLPIEATFHKCIVELLTDAVTFTEKLESHLQSVRSIPQVPNIIKNMDTALTKTEVFVMELEELTEQILKWRELQKEVYSDSIRHRAELDFGLYLT
ncbi:PREDICTED: HAUS augmin-like complex subunit 2 [Lepidothrix coronata]|uniref:HAUS augmin-like complex subunit 2 n=1 Tax=Lepidothrix coronata TaxID=321398 RepID=A0A6J0GQL5_9PASS|nr:PREDICTED: HAUS augmin-like complex subunit 2 [Lepidothrix coronata]